MPSYRLPRRRRPVAVWCALLLGWAMLLVGPPTAWADPPGAGPELTLPDDVTFVVGEPTESYVIEADGDAAPTISVDRLPPGLRLVAHRDGTASIEGSPTGPPGVSSVAVVARDGSGSTTVPLTVTVQQAPALVVSSPLEFRVGELGTVQVRTVGFPAPGIALDGDLPAGLTFVDNGDGTATIGGAPQAPDTAPVTLRAANVVSDASQTTTIQVLPGAAGPAASSTVPSIGRPITRPLGPGG